MQTDLTLRLPREDEEEEFLRAHRATSPEVPYFLSFLQRGYALSMLGAEVDWVRNVKAAGGNVVLRHGRREEVRLEEIPPNQRARVLKAYLKRAPGARPHLPVDKDAPLSEFEQGPRSSPYSGSYQGDRHKRARPMSATIASAISSVALKRTRREASSCFASVSAARRLALSLA
jgi:hypothetical protein